MSKAITEEKLRHNYIRLAKILHPDLNPDNLNADKQFQELQEQYKKAQKILGIKIHYQASVSITLKEAIIGTERYFSTDDDNQKFVLHIPAGVKNHQTILFRGLAINSIKDAVLHIKVFINLPTKFSIIGDQLILKENISFWKLYFGGTTYIEGPDGKRINLVIPKKTKNGKMFKVNGAGLLDRVTNKRLPLYIQFFGCLI
jgi:DnaJ-class molecular chaperone